MSVYVYMYVYTFIFFMCMCKVSCGKFSYKVAQEDVYLEIAARDFVGFDPEDLQ